jgi:hypothetical protein
MRYEMSTTASFDLNISLSSIPSLPTPFKPLQARIHQGFGCKRDLRREIEPLKLVVALATAKIHQFMFVTLEV